MKTLILTDEERALVLNHRQALAAYEAREAKKRNCIHTWTEIGRHRGEDYFECRLCGKTKFE